MNLVEVLLFGVVVTEVGEMDMLDEEAVEEMVRMMPTMSMMTLRLTFLTCLDYFN